MAGSELPQAGLKTPVTGSKNNDLRIGVGQNPIGYLQKQIDSFLIDKPAHHAEDKGVVSYIKTHTFLKNALADALAGQIVSAVVRRQCSIG